MILKTRMELYESQGIERLMPRVPAMARLDGRAFHSFTSSLARPYDERLTRLMQETTCFLVKETNASMGYTQSDEITLTWYSDHIDSQVFFNGRVRKMVSILAALASCYFNKHLPEFLPEKSAEMPVFDARVWSVPTLEEGANVFLWRELDATKNSITMAALSKFSHNKILGKSGIEKLDMMINAGLNWNDFPADFKRGSYFQKRLIEREFTVDEIERLPPKHAARTNPQLKVVRVDYQKLEMPVFSKVTNRADVVYNGAEPKCKDGVELVDTDSDSV